jgi:hypothetical protein
MNQKISACDSEAQGDRTGQDRFNPGKGAWGLAELIDHPSRRIYNAVT